MPESGTQTFEIMIETDTIGFKSSQIFCLDDFAKSLGENPIYYTQDEIDGKDFYYIFRSVSTTKFQLFHYDDCYELSIDPMACYEDYKFFPYLVDSLSLYLCGQPLRIEDKTAYDVFDEDWMSYLIGEEVAYLKCMLSVGERYYLAYPIEIGTYVDIESLHSMGVSIYSSTPRIYGYVQYLISHDLLDNDEPTEAESYWIDNELMIDVPQHDSIGTVKSWQLDGSETIESYCTADIELLHKLADRYLEGYHVPGVVLNDIGTIHQYGIGCLQSTEGAIYWYEEAMRMGDMTYAPTSLGDIYRKGCHEVKPDLKKAFEAYMQSEDPYAWYRIGQAYEEGWVKKPDIEMAMYWYEKAAKVGHHLAIKRLQQTN